MIVAFIDITLDKHSIKEKANIIYGEKIEDFPKLYFIHKKREFDYLKQNYHYNSKQYKNVSLMIV